MEDRRLLNLLILLLALSYLLPLRAVPLSRSLNLENEHLSVRDIMDQVEDNVGEMMKEDDLFVHGRMDMESNDYPGSGANNRHDPKSPGRI